MADWRPWFERDPECLEYEFRALGEEGISFQVQEEIRAQGLLVLDLEYPLPDGETISLTARYPDGFPFFRPEVYANTSDLSLPRHQNPFEGNLCLLPRPTRAWNPKWTLARLLTEQIPQVLERGQVTEPEEMAEGEQAEPITDFYPYEDGLSILIDPPVHLADHTRAMQGRLVLGMKHNASVFIQGAVLAIQDEDKNPLVELRGDIARLYPRRVGFRWVRFDSAPHPSNLINEIIQRFPSAFVQKTSFQPVEGGKVDLLGIVFPEEYEPGQYRDGWIFLVRTIRRAKGEENVYLARAVCVDEEQFTARIPELMPARDTVVSIVGTGCLGAPAALEFARARVGELRLLDNDTVDAGATVRWPFGLAEVGKLKTEVLSRFIEEQYPWTRVVPIKHRIGAIRNSSSPAESDILKEFLEDSSLLFDASAEWGVNHYLSYWARELGIPYVAISGRHGGWGGTIMREGIHITEGCWCCFEHHMTDGTFESPPYDRSPSVQPAGCADPTFIGANFDLGEVALAGVRLAISTLCREKTGAYPDVNWDIGILSLRTSEGQPIAPNWKTHSLTRYESCGRCG